MWESPLCVVSTFYYHWSIKNLLWPLPGQNRARWEKEIECKEKGGVREMSCSCRRKKMPETYLMITQINGKGLIEDVIGS